MRPRPKPSLRRTVVTAAAIALLSLLVMFGVVVTHDDPPAHIWVIALIHTAGIAGIAFAVIGMVDSKHILGSVSNIVESMSTRYIGKFPANMDAVIELVSGAKRSLTIVCDHAGYGQFSAPLSCLEYEGKLRAKRAMGVDVSMSVYGLRRFAEAARSQLDRMTTDFRAFTEGETFQRFARFNEALAARMQPSPEQFLLHMQANETAFRQRLEDSGLRLSTTDSHMPIYMWVADDSRAIFCIVVRAESTPAPATGGRVTTSDLEYAFETRDGNLIRGLMAMAATYRHVDGTALLPPSRPLPPPHPLPFPVPVPPDARSGAAAEAHRAKAEPLREIPRVAALVHASGTNGVNRANGAGGAHGTNGAGSAAPVPMAAAVARARTNGAPNAHIGQPDFGAEIAHVDAAPPPPRQPASPAPGPDRDQPATPVEPRPTTTFGGCTQ